MRTLAITVTCAVQCVAAQLALCQDAKKASLSNTALLEMEGDIALHLVEAADKFLLKQLANSVDGRATHWRRDLTSAESYNFSIEPNRAWLRQILGLRDDRATFGSPTLVATINEPPLVGTGNGYEVFVIRWPAFGDVHGEGLMLVPTEREPVANVVALPHCDITPEQLCGLTDDLAAGHQYARHLAASGCRVIVPALIDRTIKHHGITNREWLHRAAYEMGRTMTGYDVDKTLAIVDWFETLGDTPIGVMGWGDGGLIAWYAAAVDPRIDAVCVSGAFGELQNLWRQPIDRMVFSLLTRCGDAELATMVAPRNLVVETGTAPEIDRPRQEGKRGGPYQIARPATHVVRDAASRARELVNGLGSDTWLTVVESDTPGSAAALTSFLQSLAGDVTLRQTATGPQSRRNEFEEHARHARQMHEIDRHTQALLRDSHWVRQRVFWDQLDTSSIEDYEESIAPFRHSFYEDVVGRFQLDLLPPNPRTRLIAEHDQWKRYEVVLDVFDGLFAYGILTIPNDFADGERRPVVVCQHGLEGRPQSVIAEPDYHYYKAFATELAERGFITFAPQNIYIFTDRFRTLQRKANPLGKTLYSIMTPQHQQIVDWLQSLSFIDPDRIAFYGLSYGGKTAMRVPPLVTDYCLSICSADFNEWVDKNASTHNPRSYVNTGEYEIFEWNLGHTFNYAEMAALIAPRPFMVERGHFDGVADDWTVAWEYARVRFLYAARLKISDRTGIEWFDGPHSINGQGTYEFLHRHLNWPKTE